MKNFLKKHDYLFITGICAFAVIITVYILQNVAPFGENSLLTIDFFHQYGPMLGELFDRIWNKSTLIYSFNMGMGLPLFRNFFNYLSSPFNILILLFRHRDILMSYSVIIGLKAVASAVTMNLYLNKKFGKNYMFIPLSILYAFCAYFTAYYWNIMWIDGLIMLPLVVLGIEELVNKNNILLYIISLSLMLFANYFIGYMICIFSVLYFIFYLIIQTKKFEIKLIWKKVLNFGLSSLIAGGLCAIFLIPLYFALRGISATSDIWPTSQYYDFTVIDFIFNHFSGIGSTVLKSGITTAPNISVGVMGITLLILFWINPKIDLKTKICYSALLIILILSFVIAPLDFIWHAFHVPNDLPYRYSFLYSFLLIVISAYGIINIKSLKSINVGIIYVVMLILITLMKFVPYENITSEMIIMNYVIVTIFYLSYIIFVYFKMYKKYAVIFTILTASLECIMVINNNWYIDQNIEGFYADYDGIKDILNYVKDNDNEMYRIERDSMLTFNDPSWYNYYGEVTFSSMEYENMAIMQHYLGMPGNEINSYYFKQNTPIYDMMFNLKYIIGNSVDSKRYSLFYENDDNLVYKNNYNIGLMYGVNENIKNFSNNFENPFSNQNDFIYKATGIENVLEEFEGVESDIVYVEDNKVIVKYKVLNNYDNFYLYFNGYIDFAVVNNNMYYLNEDYEYARSYTDMAVYNYFDYNEKYIINEVSEDKYIELYVGYDGYYNDEFYLYYLNNDKLDAVYNELLQNKVNIEVFKESYIKAYCNYDSNMTIYTSIPYDKGWKVYVDGKKIDTTEIDNTLLAFDVDAGEHKIELKYRIPYLGIGLSISIVSLVGLIILVKFKKEN
mgnify:CR=1 FL=1